VSYPFIPLVYLDPNGLSIWGYQGSGTSWTQIGGPAGQIYAGGDILLKTDPSSRDLWLYVGVPTVDTWRLIGNPGAAFAAGDNTIYGLTPDSGSVWVADGDASGMSWTQIGGPAGQIYAGSLGLVATDPSSGDLWLYVGNGQWEKIGNPGATFAIQNSPVVGGYTKLYGLTPNRDGVWAYDGSGMSWTQIGGPASQIYAGAYGLVAADPGVAEPVSGGNLWLYSGTPYQWEKIGGPYSNATFAVGDSTVYSLIPDGGIWSYDGSGTSWTPIGPAASQIVAPHTVVINQ
jgi:hypothetical protein